MKKPVVFMYSGQGSQYYHMGKQLYENDSRFRVWMNYVNEIASPLIGASLVDIIYANRRKSDAFDNIVYTNPALIGIEYCLTRILMERGVQPDYLLGYSLGEFTAAIVAGVLSLEEGLSLSVQIAELLKAKLAQGGMLAIVASETILVEKAHLFQTCWLSCRNFDGNFVVAGQQSSIRALHESLQSEGIVSQLLPVNYAFHTHLLDPIENSFKSILQTIPYRNPDIQIISSFKSGVVDYIDESFFWEITRFPVEFEQTILKLLEIGDFRFIDIGPSGTLATHIKYLLPANSKSTHHETINRFGNDLMTLNKLFSPALEKSHSH